MDIPSLRVLIRGLWLIVATFAIAVSSYGQAEPEFFPIPDSYGRSEGDGPNPFTIYARLSAASSNTISVQWSTSNGTARAGLDYVAANGTMVFPPGITYGSFTVTMLGDMLPNTNRTFYVYFSNAVNAALRTNQFLATIRDDEDLFVPPGFSWSVVATNIFYPTDIAFAPDGRLFVCREEGRIRLIRDGREVTPSFARVTTTNYLQAGLQGMVFDPGFPSNNFFYVQYTVPEPNSYTRISRFTAAGNQAVPGSEHVILEIDRRSSHSQLGKGIHFGADGKLYIAVGDHGYSTNAQRLDSLSGKILRINSDGTIPGDNPFYNSASGVYRAIWALGLHNPLSFAIHPETGRVLINDVGLSPPWVELNEGFPGANYGWPLVAGPTNSPPYISPIYSYQPGCGFPGATFYHPARQLFPPEYTGSYFFSDYCRHRILRLTVSNTVEQFGTNFGPADLEVGPDGALYAPGYGPRAPIYRLGYGPRFRAIRLLPDNELLIHVWGAPQRTYYLEVSSNLTEWQPMSTNTPVTAEFEFSDTVPADRSQRFYRIREEGF